MPSTISARPSQMKEARQSWSATAIAATIPFCASLVIGLRAASRPRDTSDYFLYGRSLSATGFLSTSVGYSLQVAAVFLFFYWATAYGAKAIFVPIAWFSGYLLVREALRRGALDAFLAPTATQTIHGFVGGGVDRHRRFLVVLLALTTVAGLGGTLVSELDYVSGFVLSALGIESTRGPVIIQVAVLFFGGFYVLWGGYRAVVETDRVQVPFAYVSFVVVLFITLSEVSGRGYGLHAALLASGAVALLALFASLRLRLPGTPAERNQTLLVFVPLGLLLFYVALRGLSEGNSETAIPAPEYWPDTPSWFGFGVIGVVSLGVTNALWQFVDISSLQRLQSVDSSEAARKSILRGLTATAWESSGVWILTLIFALGLRLLGLKDGDVSELGTFSASIRKRR